MQQQAIVTVIETRTKKAVLRISALSKPWLPTLHTPARGLTFLCFNQLSQKPKSFLTDLQSCFGIRTATNDDNLIISKAWKINTLLINIMKMC